MDTIIEFCKKTQQTFEYDGQVFYYLAHPKELLLKAWTAFNAASFFICVIACLIAVIIYIMGYEKGKKYAFCSMLLYVIIRMINVGV